MVRVVFLNVEKELIGTIDQIVGKIKLDSALYQNHVIVLDYLYGFIYAFSERKLQWVAIK